MEDKATTVVLTMIFGQTMDFLADSPRKQWSIPWDPMLNHHLSGAFPHGETPTGPGEALRDGFVAVLQNLERETCIDASVAAAVIRRNNA